MLIAVERHGAVRSALVDSDKAAELFPWVEQFVQKEAQLMTAENRAYHQIGKQYDCYADIGTVSLFVIKIEGIGRSVIYNNHAGLNRLSTFR